MLSVCLILVWFNLGLVIHSSTINYFDFSFKPSIIFFGSMLDLRWGLIQRQDLIFWKDTHREIFFEILSNQPEIRLYLPFSDWFGTANGQCPFAVPNQSVHGKYNLISGWFDKISKRFLCVYDLACKAADFCVLRT